MKLIYLFLGVMLSISVWAHEPLAFHELSQQQLDQKHIKIRGFLYQTANGKWILADEPNLKSCCIGKKAAQQIFLEDFQAPPLSNSVVEIAGFLTFEPSWNSHGKMEKLYVLKNAVILPPEDNPYCWVLLACIPAGCSGFWLFRRRFF